MISVARVQRRNAWRYYVRGVAFGDGRRPARQPFKDAQEKAGLPPGVWMGRGLPALGLTAGETVTQRQMELLYGQGRHPDADRMERELLEDGADPETARLATVLGQPLEEIERRGLTPAVRRRLGGPAAGEPAHAVGAGRRPHPAGYRAGLSAAIEKNSPRTATCAVTLRRRPACSGCTV
ncbi:relaxase domain-containing protein [Streptomyces sp. NPDC006872]|uniref:relaxase domain-containing protein n=1 Tax=Streptomyces sp. NPDC006872 TaxID=3155720 RepID=UPI0033C0D0E9